MKWAIWFLSGLLLGSCGGDGLLRSTQPPDWALGSSPRYPDQRYITATGSAADLEKARDRALSNIAKVFRVHIDASSTTLSGVESSRQQGEEAVSARQRLAERISTHTEEILEGIRIAEQWQNTTDHTYFALAVLDRNLVGGMLEDEIRRLDRESAFLLASIENSRGDLEKIALYEQLISLQASRNNIQNNLKVIDIKGNGIKEKWSLVELRALAASALLEVKIASYVHPKAYPGLLKTLEAAMSESGFPAVSGKSDYTMIAEVDAGEPEQDDGWWWQEGEVRVRLIDSVSGITRASRSWELKASSTSRAKVFGRFHTEIDRHLKKELRTLLIDMAE